MAEHFVDTELGEMLHDNEAATAIRAGYFCAGQRYKAWIHAVVGEGQGDDRTNVS